MIFGLIYFCVVILCVNRSRSSFILYRIVKRHSRQSNVRRIWTCPDNGPKYNSFPSVWRGLMQHRQEHPIYLMATDPILGFFLKAESPVSFGTNIIVVAVPS